MLFRPLLGTDLSGSVGGIVASHNRGGAYFRNRSIPTNPNTTQQGVVRGAVNQLSSAWGTDLTQAQRDAWTTYGDNVGVQNRIGETIFLTGQQQYIRSNTPAIQAGIARQDDAPIIFDLGSFTDPTLDSINATLDQVDVAFTVADDWANEDDSHMLVYASRPQNASVNYPNIPMRLAGTIDGDLALPPASPATLDLPFPVEVGHKVFLQGRVVRADGRLSTLFRLNGLATAP